MGGYSFTDLTENVKTGAQQRLEDAMDSADEAAVRFAEAYTKMEKALKDYKIAVSALSRAEFDMKIPQG